jgi:hypothetical protein
MNEHIHKSVLFFLTASLVASILTILSMIFLNQIHLLFISKNTFSNQLLPFFIDFVIYGILLDPLG